MLPLLLAALIVSGSIDAGSTHYAITAQQAREGNPLLPKQPWAIDGVIAGSTLYTVAVVRHQWAEGHHTKAILLTGIVVGVHTAAGYHNLRTVR